MIERRTLVRLGLVTAAVALVVVSNGQSQPATSAPAGLVPAAVEKAAHAYLTQAALEAPIRFLASDLLEGRGPATRGDELARLYLQTQLEGIGYQPAFANGAWQQPFDIVGLKAQFPKTWSFTDRAARWTSAGARTTSQSAGCSRSR